MLEVKDLAIYGAGGLGREVALMVEEINRVNPAWNTIGFFDDRVPSDRHVDGLPVLGNQTTLNAWQKELSVVVAIADGLSRRNVVSGIKNDRIDFPVLIHPSALRGSQRNSFGKGSIVSAGCVLTTGIVLEDFVFLNLMCTVGHDVVIGQFSSLMSGSNISGNVRIGCCSLVGAGAQILQRLEIGKRCTVGAGAVVTRDVKDDNIVMGVPARRRDQPN